MVPKELWIWKNLKQPSIIASDISIRKEVMLSMKDFSTK